jgi:hypothetical protein
LVGVELILPVAVDGSESALLAPAAQIKPADSFAILVQRQPDGDLEVFSAAGTYALSKFCLFEELVAVPMACSTLQSTQVRTAAPSPSSSASRNSLPPHLLVASAK